jgi:cysteinyl-tRNA synthetase
LLSAQYRSEMDFSLELLAETKVRLDAFYNALREVQDVPTIDVDVKEHPFYQALLDDLNTPIALGELRAIARDLNKAEATDKPRLKSLLIKAGDLIGLLQQDPEAWFMQASSGQVTGEQVEALIAERIQAKLDKNFGRADEIRDELLAQGVILEDKGKTNTQWRRE